MMDSGSTEHFVSQVIVNKLSLKMELLGSSYKMVWLKGEVTVIPCCLIKFFIGRAYREFKWCDVPLEMCHMLFGLSCNSIVRPSLMEKQTPIPSLRTIWRVDFNLQKSSES